MQKSVLIVLIVFLVTCACPAQDGGLDFTGTEEFFRIHDLLVNGIEPDEQQWSALFSAPGYAALVEKEIPEDVFKQFFRAAYLPGNEQLRESLLQKAEEVEGWFWRWFPGSFLETLDYCHINRARLESTVETFNSYPFVERAKEYIASVLGKELITGDPSIAFIVFNDSRGYEPVILSVMEIDRRLHGLTQLQKQRLRNEGRKVEDAVTLYLAHEMFHLYRAPAVEIQYPEGDTIEGFLLSRINNACNEGIADMLNVFNLYDNGRPLSDSDYGRQIAAEQADQPAAVRKLDSICSKLAKGVIAGPEASKVVRKIFTRSGHPIGYFMAREIFDARGADSLKSLACKPLDFILTYGEVAAEGDSPSFCDETLRYLQMLKARFGSSSESCIF